MKQPSVEERIKIFNLDYVKFKQKLLVRCNQMHIRSHSDPYNFLLFLVSQRKYSTKASMIAIEVLFNEIKFKYKNIQENTK
jgi:hypothetical protein